MTVLISFSKEKLMKFGQKKVHQSVAKGQTLAAASFCEFQTFWEKTVSTFDSNSRLACS
jgi:hypothetical protein